MRIHLALIASLIATPTAFADPVLDMMRNFETSGPIYAYEMTYEDGEIVARGKIDPSQPEGQRIVIYTPDQAEWSEAFTDGLEQMEAETDGDIWCKEFAESVPDRPRLTAETATRATYTFTPEPTGDRGDAKIMKRLVGEITLDKTDGAVLAYKMHAPKAFKPAIVAKITRFDMSISCARASDGRTYVQDFAMDVSGSAMMQSFDETVRRTITKLLGPVS